VITTTAKAVMQYGKVTTQYYMLYWDRLSGFCA